MSTAQQKTALSSLEDRLELLEAKISNFDRIRVLENELNFYKNIVERQGNWHSLRAPNGEAVQGPPEAIESVDVILRRKPDDRFERTLAVLHDLVSALDLGSIPMLKLYPRAGGQISTTIPEGWIVSSFGNQGPKVSVTFCRLSDMYDFVQGIADTAQEALELAIEYAHKADLEPKVDLESRDDEF